MFVRNPHPDVEIPDVSLFDFLFTDFGDRAEAPAFIDGRSSASIGFAELKDMVLKVAAALAECGVASGDVVGVFGAQHAVLPGGLPRDPARERDRDQRQLALHTR